MKITPDELRTLIREEAVKLEEAAGRSMDDAIADLVSSYQSKGMRLEDLQDAIRDAWMSARRAARSPRTAAQRAATAKKSAATRAANKERHAAGEKRWAASQKRFRSALESELTPRQLQRYKEIEQDVALSGSKEGGSPGSILRQMGVSDDVIDRILADY